MPLFLFLVKLEPNLPLSLHWHATCHPFLPCYIYKSKIPRASYIEPWIYYVPQFPYKPGVFPVITITYVSFFGIFRFSDNSLTKKKLTLNFLPFFVNRRHFSISILSRLNSILILPSNHRLVTRFDHSSFSSSDRSQF